MRQYKRPTRRKPDRQKQQIDYNTEARYESPWWVTLYAILAVALVVGTPALLSYGYLNGWWG